MPHISHDVLDHVRTVLATASDQVERSIAYGQDPAEYHAAFHRAKRALSEYLQQVERVS
jgi:predicted AlkP superfamily pyrophosphatase or phosphodiesterase